MNQAGIHIRFTNLKDTIEKAIRLNVPFFQTFLILNTGKYPRLTENEIKEYLILRNKYFKDLYLHGSYWINLCNPNISAYKILKKELLLAKKLNFTHLILHPGAATACKSKLEGIELLARSLNKILKDENHIKIVLENTAHHKLSVGGDLNDFKTIIQLLDQPEKIYFCIDTAHAYSYGYNISDNKEQDNFIELIKTTIGLKNISLIHLNDTHEKLGSKIDKHCIPGEGNIGQIALKRLIQNPDFKNFPILIEPPILEENIEKQILENVKEWTKNII